MALTNAQLSELLLRAAEIEDPGHRRTALERAARGAVFRWPEEASAVLESGRALTELRGVGPWVARIMLELFSSEAFDEPPDPPPLRRGFLTLAEARATVSEHEDWRSEIRSDLQMHTTYSDGKAPLREMVQTCREVYGYEHILITDHSVGLAIARGMDEATLAAEAAEIARVNEELDHSGERFRVLHGLEMNLSPQGQGDMPAEVVSRLAVVLGAFHSQLRVTEDQTARYLLALRNPTVHTLAHPRCRRYNVRLGLQADWERVVGAAAEQGTALEIDGFPDRQDLDVETLELARDAGAWISLGTDAHRTTELSHMEFSLAAAIRAGIPKERILNFMAREDLLAWAARER